jgi:hypothetical protein
VIHECETNPDEKCFQKKVNRELIKFPKPSHLLNSNSETLILKKPCNSETLYTEIPKTLPKISRRKKFE